MADFVELLEEPIRLDSQGVWYHGEDLINSKVADLFSRSIHIFADGSYGVSFGRKPQKIETVDTAFFVRRLECFTEGEGVNTYLERVELYLSDGTHELLDPSTLMQSVDNGFYCRLERGEFLVPCKFLPRHYHALGEWFSLESGLGFLCMANKQWPILAYHSAPISVS